MDPRPSATLKWVFTLNNYTDLEEAQAQAFESRYMVYGREVSKTLTPHLQGFVIFSKKQRLTALKKLSPRAYWAAAEGTDAQASKYAKKDGDFFEKGDLSTKQGKRNDWREILSMVKRKATDAEIMETFPGQFARNFSGIKKMRLTLEQPPIPKHHEKLFPWQRDLWDVLEKPAEDRPVFFIVDKKGNQGKSWFTRHYVHSHPHEAQAITCGKYADMAYSIKDSIKVLFIDCSRAKTEFLSYDLIEHCKNGSIESPKYESHTKYFSGPLHVVVMMNEAPDYTKLSSDRYVVTSLDDDGPFVDGFVP